MSTRTTAGGALVAACLVGLTACSTDTSEPPRPAASRPAAAASMPAATPSPTPSTGDDAAALLDAARSAVESAPAIRFRTEDLTGAGAPSSATSDGRSGNFEAHVPWHGRTIVMRRIGDLTWTRAPAGFWTGLGYTAASAARAEGKWVVARSAQIRQVEQLFDPGALLEWLRKAGAGEVQEVDRGGRRVLRVRVGATLVEAGVVAPHGRARLTSITVFHGDRPVSRSHLTVLDAPVALVAPDADDVLQKEALRP
ncbi:hypothetical protein [Nocardioides sp. LML1-1-1.1]|uniref:hypothetical protein n=1 Tax=Nocardioides sp. LML1-1-1.1 TaxID=3135248 RepID=UPI003449F267